MQRLVCIVEGKGDVQAVPRLCARILHSVGATNWYVEENAIRQHRSQLVDARVKSPSRPCREEGLRKALAMAEARRPDAILILCDSDDDCPVVWASSIQTLRAGNLPRGAVMAVREFEGWLLWSFDDAALRELNASNPEQIRDAKGKLARLVPGYTPTTHQLELARRVDVLACATVRRASISWCGRSAPSAAFLYPLAHTLDVEREAAAHRLFIEPASADPARTRGWGGSCPQASVA